VDGLESEFTGEINFYRLNVEIPANEQIQQSYGLRGHPSAVILSKDGVVVKRYFGAETAVILRPVLQEITQ